MTGNLRGISLEPTVQNIVDATAEPSLLYRLSPETGREAVDKGVDTSRIAGAGGSAVRTRYGGIVYDLTMVNSLYETEAAGTPAVAVPTRALHS